MLYQTVIHFYLDSHSGLSKEQVAEKILSLSEYLLKLYVTYEWGIKDPKDAAMLELDLWTTDVDGLRESFNDFSAYIKNHGSDDENGCCIVSDSSPRYQPNGVNVKNGDIRFDSSFVIDKNNFHIYVNTDKFYAADFKRLPSSDLGFSCEMSGFYDDYFTFKV